MLKLQNAKIVSEAQKHHLIGNVLCLDFANTLYGHGGTPIHEYLYDYGDLVVWSRKAELLTSAQAAKLLHFAERQPNEAKAVFHRAIALRELVFRVFAALALGQAPKSTDLAALNNARLQALMHSRIERSPAGFKLDWDDRNALDHMLWEIMLSAGDLLTSNERASVRQCSGTTCDWLFLDTSRNHMRRWCSMRVCGNRAKVHRFMAKQRKPVSQS